MFNGRSTRRRPTPRSTDEALFPTRQLFILALCRICEPIAFMSIFPYIYYMVLSFNITRDERQAAIYAGMVTSSFALAEFSASVFWGRLSDRVGRKPVLLTGLAGTGISMLVFGFARNLPVALLARALGGILNGNIGVLNTAVAEVVTVEAHQPRAFSVMPFVWCLGSIIGAGLGGALAEPVKSYPTIFKPDGLFDHFPYLLPNLVCTVVVVLGLVVGILFLEETHEDKKCRRDIGVEAGRAIKRVFRRSSQESMDKTKETDLVLPQDEKRLSYQSTDSCPITLELEPTDIDTTFECDSQYSPIPSIMEKLSWRQGFTKQVMLIIVGYGILAFHTIALEQLLPILFSMPESETPPSGPFKFTGGFALSTKTIGMILSSQGFLQMIAQLLVFPVVTRKLGSLKTFRVVIFLYPMYYCLVPYVALLPKQLRYPGIYLLLIFKVTAQSLSFPSTQIMLANAAPSKRVLGTLNGFAASSASLARAFGPTLAGLVQSWGLNIGYSGLPWWSCALVAVLGATVSTWMKDKKRSSQASGLSRPSHEEDELIVQPLLTANNRDSSVDDTSPIGFPRHSEVFEDHAATLPSKEHDR